MTESCIFCAHNHDVYCDIHDCSVAMHNDENHGCTYWQPKEAEGPHRCGECSGFAFNSAAETWGICKQGYIKKEIHRNTYACDKFFEEGESVPKRTYWTKCGRQFEKNSTATVTGYTIEDEVAYIGDVRPPGRIKDDQCRACPFVKEVYDGWGDNKRFLRYECRAGSQPPNYRTDWTGSLDDKNSIHIHSLDFDLLERIRKYCEEHPDLSASYNSDSMPDCRMTLAVYCSPNKKGISAKHELIEKFLSANNDKPENAVCKDCVNFIPHYDVIWEHGKCKHVSPLYFVHDRRPACEKFVPRNDKTINNNHASQKEEVREMEAQAIAENTALEIAKSEEDKTFDYSSIDEETAVFLQEKAIRIIEIRFKSVVAIGKELKEAHDRLANNKTGTFEKWVESIGISHKTARNYINGYEYILKNFQHIEEAEKIQPSLLFEISKPSAPKQLQEAVLAGDITSHKQYKELEAKLRKTETDLARAREFAQKQAKYADEHMMRARQAEKKAADMENAMQSLEMEKRTKEKEIDNLRQQIDQLKRNSDPSKLQELGEIIKEKQQEILDYQKQVGNLNRQLAELQKQLKEKPIEITATQTVEVIPDDVALAIYDKVSRFYEGLNRLTDKEIQVYAEQVDPDYYDEIAESIENAITVLERIRDRAYEESMKAIATTLSGRCGECIHADMNKVTDEQLDDGKALCAMRDTIVDFEDPACQYYKSIRESEQQ